MAFATNDYANIFFKKRNADSELFLEKSVLKVFKFTLKSSLELKILCFNTLNLHNLNKNKVLYAFV